MKKSKQARARAARLVQEPRVGDAVGIDAAQVEGDRAIFGADDHVTAVLELTEQAARHRAAS